jgi:hypothetical protein
MTVTHSGLVYNNGVLLPWHVLVIMILVAVSVATFLDNAVFRGEN